MKKQLLTGALLLASFLSVQAQDILTSFESSEDLGYTVGANIGDYTDLWSTQNSVTTSDVAAGVIVISNNWASEGTQSLYFPAQNVNTADGSDVNYAVTAPIDFSGVESPFYIGFDTKTNAVDPDGGANFYVELINDAGTSIGSVVFNFDGTIKLADYAAQAYVDGGTFTGDAASSLRFKFNDDGSFSYYVGGTAVATYTPDSADLTGAYFLAFGADDWGTDWSVDNIVVAQGTAGIAKNTVSKFNVFPNPANNVINIANSDNALVNNVSIVDINGRTVKSVKYDGVANATVNVSDLAKGVYVMTISSDKGATTQKIVKN